MAKFKVGDKVIVDLLKTTNRISRSTKSELLIGEVHFIKENTEMPDSVAVKVAHPDLYGATTIGQAMVTLERGQGGWWNINDVQLVTSPTDCKCSCVEDKPVMCACAAKEILEAQGYTVTPPKEPLTGEAYVYQYPDGDLYPGRIRIETRRITSWEGAKLIAKVPWTKGDGL